MVDDYVVRMSKLSISFFFIGLALLGVWTWPCDGSPLSRDSSESNETDNVGKMLQEIRAQCIKNTGSDTDFPKFMASVEHSMMCLADFDTEKFKIDFNELTNATRGTFFPKYCHKIRSFVSCINISLIYMQPCLESSAFQIAKALIDSIPEASNLACKNDGEIIFQLKDEERKECIMQKEDEISTCFNTFKTDMNGIIDFAELKQDQCGPLTNFRQCLKDILDHCDLSDIVSVYDIPLNAMLPLTPCANYTQTTMVHLLDNNSVGGD
ncbi:27 kDa hemolymph protein-like [Anopheles darlingi]|uniref:27 kDa hemolymph protein-like n=1 Tax=Anopheles darlingi TaxID=43151 RepID=UPI002100076F|nr:27 kDa hemolymph protein-like [Anopheles darlingi]